MLSFIRAIVKGLQTALKYTKIINVVSNILSYSSEQFEQFANTLKEEEKPQEKTQKDA